MTSRKESRILNNIVSPYGLAMFSYAFFLLACLIPPSIYSRTMMEPDLMFLDPATILFYTLCVLSFVAGVWLFERIVSPPTTVEPEILTAFSPTKFLLIPLSLAIALCVLSSILLVRNNPLVIPILLAKQGQELQLDDGSGIQLEGTLNIAVLFLTGIAWWVAWRSPQLDLKKGGKRLVKLSLAVAVLAEFVSSSLNLIRHPFTVVVTGLMVIYILMKSLSGEMTWKLIARTGFLCLAGGTLFFLLVEMLRGGSADDLAGVFIGYTLAPYNRLAALLHGQLHLEYARRGLYFSNFLSFNHTFNRFIPFARTMNFPEYFNWWRSVFASVERAGLNARLIFFGTFGEIFAEIGWFAPVYVFGYGLMYGQIWRWMKRGNLAGILLYPYLAYCILFWFSTNNVFDQDAVALVLDVMLLGTYEFFFAKQATILVAVPQSE
jgi:hypothetical protein